MIDPTQQQQPPPASMPATPAALPTGPQPAGSGPALPGAGASPTMPTGMPQMPTPPPTPAPPLPPVQRTGVPNERQPADKVNNTFERVATLLVDGAEDQGVRLARNLNEVPADSVPRTPDQVRRDWYYSPAGNVAAADQLFWQTHDQVLQQTGDHAQAEQKALEAAYPRRATLAGVGTATVETQVQKAEAIRKTIDGGQAPDSSEVAHEHDGRTIELKQQAGYA